MQSKFFSLCKVVRKLVCDGFKDTTTATPHELNLCDHQTSIAITGMTKIHDFKNGLKTDSKRTQSVLSPFWDRFWHQEFENEFHSEKKTRDEFVNFYGDTTPPAWTFPVGVAKPSWKKSAKLIVFQIGNECFIPEVENSVAIQNRTEYHAKVSFTMDSKLRRCSKHMVSKWHGRRALHRRPGLVNLYFQKRTENGLKTDSKRTESVLSPFSVRFEIRL